MKPITTILAALTLGCASSPEPAPPATPPPPTNTVPIAVSTTRLTRAVCIGWNRVDPAAWDGWSGDLPDCEFDATFWHDTWTEFGIESTQLLTQAATRQACRSALRWATHDMVDDDLADSAGGFLRRFWGKKAPGDPSFTVGFHR